MISSNTTWLTNPFRQRLWAWAVQKTVLPFGDRVFGQRMMRHLDFLRRAQNWPRERILETRHRALAALMDTVYREVPLYRELMDAAHLTPGDFHSTADLQKFPVITKSMLRAGYPSKTVRETGQKTYEACSSGSTGTPFCVREDSYTAGLYRAAFLLALEWAGWEIGLPHVQTGITPVRSRGRRIKDALLRCHYVSAYDLHDDKLDAALEYMEAHKIKYLWGYPGSIYYLALRASQRGWNRPLIAVATWGDTLFPHLRATIEHAFQTRVYDQYGCGEGITISAQCGTGSTYHQFDTDVIVEYVDDQYQPVPAGQIGNVLVTRLHPGPMPLIRYQLGDVGVSGGDKLCPCGCTFSMMESIQGRDTDIIETPAGNRLIVHFFTGILEYFNEVETFQVVQDDPQSIILRMVPRTTIDADVIKRILAELRAKGADINIQTEIVSEIPLSSAGKRRFIINNWLKTQRTQVPHA